MTVSDKHDAAKALQWIRDAAEGDQGYAENMPIVEGVFAAIASAPTESGERGDGLPELIGDETDLEVLQHFVRMCREMKPVGQWPGERLCTAIKHLLAPPRPFIEAADRAPERGHNGRGGDTPQSLPPFRPAQQCRSVRVDESIARELRKLCSWMHLMSYNESYFGEPSGELKSTVYAIERMLPAATAGAAK